MHKEPVKFTKWQLEKFQPEITKLMRGLSVNEKISILKNCFKDKVLKKNLNGSEANISN